jgi:DUF1365 family protein
VTARLYECRITHARTVPLRNVFTYRTYLWLVDLDHLPRSRRPGPRRLARFQARDHIGDPHRGIRENLDHFLAGHGIDLAGGRVTMLAHARMLGYVFCRTAPLVHRRRLGPDPLAGNEAVPAWPAARAAARSSTPGGG